VTTSLYIDFCALRTKDKQFDANPIAEMKGNLETQMMSCLLFYLDTIQGNPLKMARLQFICLIFHSSLGSLNIYTMESSLHPAHRLKIPFIWINSFQSVTPLLIMTRNIHYKPGIDYSTVHRPSTTPHHAPGLAISYNRMQPKAPEFWTLATNLNLFNAYWNEHCYWHETYPLKITMTF
jgi:hypothetical protein